VIDATTHRLRPIVLTAAASLGMIPIAVEGAVIKTAVFRLNRAFF
jgi:multidrug efflux pump subunit AcrB